jgi:predicted membrane channel-forming protein YqfA (hemolysin III family)
MKNLFNRFLNWVWETRIRYLWFIIFLVYGAITLMFIFLKLVDTITVSWWVIFIPVYIVGIVYAIYKIIEVVNKGRKKNL